MMNNITREAHRVWNAGKHHSEETKRKISLARKKFLASNYPS